jgi:hypothetical protein
MDRILGRILVAFTVMMPATLAVLRAAGIPQPATMRNPEDALRNSVPSTPDDEAVKTAKRKNLLIIGDSSLIDPLDSPNWWEPCLRAKGFQ